MSATIPEQSCNMPATQALLLQRNDFAAVLIIISSRHETIPVA